MNNIGYKEALKKVAHSYGGELRLPADAPKHLANILLRAAQQTPDKGILYLQADGSEQTQSYHELLEEAKRILAGLRKQGLEPQDKVIFQLDNHRDFISAFWGCLLGGFVPVPFSVPPIYEQTNSTVKMLYNTWQSLEQPLVLTSQPLVSKLHSWYNDFRVETVEELRGYQPDHRWHVSQPDDLALLMFTSGSTGIPKGVRLSHRNLLSNVESSAFMMNYLVNDGISLNWLHLHHIGSLVRCCLRDIYVGNQQIHAPTQMFLSNPPILLDWIERYRVTSAWLPNFALGLINKHADTIKQKQWDLSSLKSVLSAAEPIVPQTAKKFYKLLAPYGFSIEGMHSAWGMSEAVASIVISRQYLLNLPSNDYPFVEVGKPIPNCSVRIVDDQGEITQEDVVGQVQIKGPMITCGYYQNPELNQESFTPDGWLKTGDLGFLREGCLTITGRQKDVIIINGVNYYAHEIEAIVDDVRDVETSYTVACAIRQPNSNTDELLIFFHSPKAEDETLARLLKEIQGSVVSNIGVSPTYLIPLDKAEIPKSSAGKILRYQLKERFDAGEFDPLLKRVDRLSIDTDFVPPRTPTEDILATIWADILGLEQVGIYNNFFELGGHSLLATQVISRLCDAFSVEIPLIYLFENPTVAELAAKITQSQAEMADLKLKKNFDTVGKRTIPRRANRDAAPLSFAQQRLWFLQQLEPESPFYNITRAMRLNGTLNVVALQQALNAIVARHEVLRTTLVSLDGNPKQIIAESRSVELPVIVVENGKNRIEQEAEIQRLNRVEVQRLFNLSSDLMLRATLLRLEPTEHLLILVMHHIASDGWSMGILFRELSALYDAFATDQPSPLPPLPIQYADFAHWQRQWLTGDVLETQLNYWKQQLTGAPGLLELPTDHPRPPIQRFQGKKASLQLSPELTAQLKNLSQQTGTTLFMTLLSAFATLLSRYSGQSDLVIGSPIANRTHRQIESLIGFFVNTLALRIDLNDNPRFEELLRRVRRVAIDAYAHQDIPFEKLVEELQPERNLSHTPLFQVMFVLQNPSRDSLELSGLSLTPIAPENVTAKFDMTLSMRETAQGLVGRLEYNTNLFEPTTITRLVGHFQTLLEGIVKTPQQSIAELPLLTETESQQLMAWNDTATDYPVDQCLHQLFEAQVEKTPDAVAVVFEAQQLTYRELNNKANQLAHYLQTLGVKPEVLVGICMERSIDMLIGLLGILKAGGAYLPLDPAYPATRLAFMLEDAQVPVLMTTKNLQSGLSEHHSQIVCLDALDTTLSTDNPMSGVAPSNLAYVIYTSGSTGKPKGVMISHRSVVNFLSAMRLKLDLTDQDIFLAVTTISFDIAALELYLPLIIGARVVLVSREVAQDGVLLFSTLIQSGVTVMQATTATWRLLLTTDWEDTPQLKIISGGEALPRELANQLLEKSATVWNLYGPTETTIWSSAYSIERNKASGEFHDDALEPLGYPIANTQIYILDKNRKLVPIGVPGELHIGGAGLSRGYLNRPDLTAEKFIPNPFNKDPNSRLYKTGDLARYLPDGNIEFLGRLDNQVKIRGFRIELGEIEAVLAQHPTVQECVVIVHEDSRNDKRLVAYLVLNKEQVIDNIELRRLLKERLPDYMIPSAFMQLEVMPLTPNGKIDRQALSQLSINSYQLSEKHFVVPQTPEEELLAGIWANVLGIKEVSIHDNFFELGGHSLLATQVISRVGETFSVELPLRQLFESPTIAGLSEHLKTICHDHSRPPITPLNQNEPRPLSFVQQRLWFLEQLEGSSATYNMSSARYLEGQLNRAALEQSLQTLVQRHETLRTTFQILEEQPVQVISPVGHWSLNMVDLQDLNTEEQDREIQRLVNEEAQRPFDLSKGPLFRATLLQKGVESHILMLTMHHIISDGWSIGIFNRELSTLYQAFCQDQPSPLPPLPIQYADFAHWQRQWLTGDVLETQLNYWKKQLTGAPGLLELPTDHPRPPIQRFQGKKASLQLSPELTSKLKNLSQQTGTTLFMTLLSAFATLLSRYSGQSDIVIGSPIANRTHRQIEPLIGFLVNTLVLRIDLSNNPRFEELLRRVKQVALDAYTHQDIPFEKLFEELRPERNLSHTPLFQVMFVLQNPSGNRLELSGLSLTPIVPENVTAKFDITLSMRETAQGMVGQLEYNTDLFKTATITRMLGHFETLLEGIVKTPQQPIAELPLLTETESQQLMAWNDTATDYPQDQCIHQLFEDQVETTPDAIAVVFEDQQLTYFQLNNKANQLAHYLQTLGVKPEVLVGICIERSLEMVYGLLGILKAGGAYLPLDPTYPAARLAFMLEDAQVSVLITTKNLRGGLPHSQIVCLDALDTTLSTDNPVSGVAPSNLAYVIYTSGLTGTPKGVMIEHRSLVNFTEIARLKYKLTPHDRILQFASISFDTAAEEIYPSLISGGQIVLRVDEMLNSVAIFLQQCQKFQLTVLDLPTAYWHQLTLELANKQLKLPKSLRLVIIGGEYARSEIVDLWRQNVGTEPQLVNTYGPTEATVVATMFHLSTETDELPIGRAIHNIQTYVLDNHLQPLPIGVPGELHLGGVGLARGYLNRPELTSEKFIFKGTRLYKTGDLVRYRPDGQLEYLGRIDNQVKLRGYRIELGEIEAVLTQHPSIQETVVLDREFAADKRLVAYLVPNKEQVIDNIELRSFLKERLPDYMIPSAFMQLEVMPLTPNGKIDRRALSKLSVNSDQLSEEHFVVHQTPEEELLAGIWSDVFGVERVGIFDNFFELGGHSLLAMQIMSRVRETFSVELPLRHLFESPTIAGLNEHLKDSRHDHSLPPITPLNQDQPRPLSFAQQRLWFLEQLESNSATYNMPSARRLEGQLNRAALEQSLQTLVQRYETLRTTFQTVEGQPLPVVSPVEHWSLSVVDWQDLNAEKQDREIQSLVNEEAQRPFDLSQGPLFRATLLQKGIESHVLMLTMHHIISDGWSIGIFNRELSTLYQAFCQGQPSPLAPLPIQYADFAHWQRQWLTGDVLETQLDYWKKQLAGAPSLLELPTDHPRPPIQRFQGKTASLQLSPQLTEQLKNLSQQAGSTLFMTLLSAFATLLSRYSGQSDIVIGSPIANRTHSQIESLIGFFVNTLALRIDLNDNPRFEELLQQVRQVALDAYAHQDIPFEKLVEELQPERNPSHTPLFQVMFVLQNASRDSLELSGISLTRIAPENVTAKFDITLSMRETAQGLAGRLEYNTDLFESATITRMVGHFQTLLEGIVKTPQQSIAELPLLTETEYQQLMAWNDTATDYPVDQCIHQLFEAQVEKTPDAVAVVFEDQELSYAALNQKANQLAHYLQTLGIKPEVLVGICIERSIEMLIGLLGILKAGGAYLPLDPAYPAARLAFMLEDAGVEVLLTQSNLIKALPKTAAQVVCLDTETEKLSSLSTNNLASSVKSANLAYVMYTSGSTGQPKGVSIVHRGVVRLVKETNYVNLTADEVLLQLAPISFDASTFEIWGSLLNGAKLIVMPPQTPSLEELGRVIGQYQVTTLWLTAALFHTMVDERLEDLRPVRQLLAGGEVLSVPHVRKALRELKECQLINGYGPTENTTFTCCCCLTESQMSRSVPIGRPIANTQVYLLDQNRKPVPIGVPGELHIGGAGLARGYLNRPDLSADKFIPNPFSNEPNSSLYKTGDLARYLPDGNIEFLGRLDNQVKIRGFRIELGEIEAVLAQHPTVRKCVVIVLEESYQDKRLVAYLLPIKGQVIDHIELRTFITDRLPNYMIPSAFVQLETMPLNPNGKIDRNSLPAPDHKRPEPEETFVAPKDQMELQLTSIWEQVLGIQSIGVRDNFFDLGGHSLLAVRLFAQIEKIFGQNIPLTILFQAPTIEQLADILRQKGYSMPWSSLVLIQPGGEKPPLFCVPPAACTALTFANLAHHLGAEQPVYGLQPLGLDGKQQPHNRVEDMAAHYIKEIRTVQPEGPYYLGGTCFGGFVAFEMAQQLQAQGCTVNLLALFDTAPPYFATPTRFLNADKMGHYVRRFLYHFKFGQLKQALNFFFVYRYRRWLKRRIVYRFGNSQERRIQKVMKAHETALRNYVVRDYLGKITLFRSSEDRALENDSDGFWKSISWEKLAKGGFDCHVIEGSHQELFQEPRIQELADKLNICLDEVQHLTCLH